MLLTISIVPVSTADQANLSIGGHAGFQPFHLLCMSMVVDRLLDTTIQLGEFSRG